ncbi:MAG: DUF512 domain-containing protein [Rhodothermales bacterium]|nr:DUF512 domain-containing protein [Rhodothermales bacterium]
MPVKVNAVAPGSVADRLGWRPGDMVLAVDGQAVQDELDFRFKAAEEAFTVKVRVGGQIVDQVVVREWDEPLGADFEEFRIKTCGDDCVFCFVDQNPAGLRDTLYFRDGDFRMSFLYGNYVTMTNLRERDLQRIVEQRLSPLYISVHCTDGAIRRRMMGHRAQDDRLMEKLEFLRDGGIDMHAQVVLVPGFNDGAALEKTVADLYAMNDRMESLSVVPVGLTGHRRGLTDLRCLTPEEARALVAQVHDWQRRFRAEIGRGFVYCSDEMYLLAGVDFPPEADYDGYPLMENGVGMSRDFLNELGYQRDYFPDALPEPKTLTLVTGTLTAPLLRERVAPVLEDAVDGLTVQVVACENRLFGDSVTVSGLLNFKSFAATLRPLADAGALGDRVVLPPDSVNFEGLFLDNRPGQNTPEELSAALGGVPVEVFGGDWTELLDRMAEPVAA